MDCDLRKPENFPDFVRMPRLKLPSGKILEPIALGWDNLVKEEIQNLCANHEPETKPEGCEMMLVDQNGKIIVKLDDDNVIEDYREEFMTETYHCCCKERIIKNGLQSILNVYLIVNAYHSCKAIAE